MAYVNATAILTRLREVLDSAAGDLRTIAAARFSSGLYTGQERNASSIQAMVSPRVEPSITSMAVNEASPMSKHSMQLRDIDIEVKVVRSAQLNHKLTSSERDTLNGLAVQDADVIAQALNYPGNMSATTAGTSTGLISGVLLYVSSDIDQDLDGETSAIITSIHQFSGVVNVTAATS